MDKPNLYPWEVISSQVILESKPWMKINVQQVRLPDGQVVDDYHHISIADHVIIYAETEEGLVIIERQYKHGVGRVSLTLPAGGIHDGEEPLAAAERELLEETGYSADTWQELGVFVVHGNYGCGKAHIFKATGAKKVAPADSGDLEEMEILLMKPEDVSAALFNGDVALMGTAAAISLATSAPLLRPVENSIVAQGSAVDAND